MSDFALVEWQKFVSVLNDLLELIQALIAKVIILLQASQIGWS